MSNGSGGSRVVPPPKKESPEKIVEPVNKLEDLASKLNKIQELKENLNSNGVHLDSDAEADALRDKFMDALSRKADSEMRSMELAINKFHAQYTLEAEKQARAGKAKAPVTSETSEPLKKDIAGLSGDLEDAVRRLHEYSENLEKAAKNLAAEKQPQIAEIKRLDERITESKGTIEKEAESARLNIGLRLELVKAANEKKSELFAQIAANEAKVAEEDAKLEASKGNASAKESAYDEKKEAAANAEAAYEEAFDAYDKLRNEKGLSEPEIAKEAKKPDSRIETDMLEAVELYRSVAARDSDARKADKEMKAAEAEHYLALRSHDSATEARNLALQSLKDEREKLEAGIRATASQLTADLSDRKKAFSTIIERIGKAASSMQVSITEQEDRITALRESALSIEGEAKALKNKTGVDASGETMNALTALIVKETEVPADYIPQHTGVAKLGKQAPIVRKLLEEERSIEAELKATPPPPPPPPVEVKPGAKPEEVVKPPEAKPPEAKPEEKAMPPPPPPEVVKPEAKPEEKKEEPKKEEKKEEAKPGAKELRAAADAACVKICQAMAREKDGKEKALADMGAVITKGEMDAIRTTAPSVERVKRDDKEIKFLSADGALVSTLDLEGKQAHYKTLGELEAALFPMESSRGEKPFGEGSDARSQYEKLKKKLVEANKILEKPLDSIKRKEARYVDKTLNAVHKMGIIYPGLRLVEHDVSMMGIPTDARSAKAVHNVAAEMLATEDLKALGEQFRAITEMWKGPQVPVAGIDSVIRSMGVTNEAILKDAKSAAKAADKLSKKMTTRSFIKLKMEVRDSLPAARDVVKEYMKGSRLVAVIPLMPWGGEVYKLPERKAEWKLEHFIQDYDNRHRDSPLTKTYLKEIKRIGGLVDDIQLGRAWTRKTFNERTAFDIMRELGKAGYDSPTYEVISAYIENKRGTTMDNIARQVDDGRTLVGLADDAKLSPESRKAAMRLARISDDIEYWRGWTRATLFRKSGWWLDRHLAGNEKVTAVVEGYIEKTGKKRVRKRLDWASGKLEPGPMTDAHIGKNAIIAAKKLNEEGLGHYFNFEYAKAVKSFGEALEKNPNFIGAWENKRDAHYALGQREEALAALDNADELRLWEVGLKRLNKQVRDKLYTFRADCNDVLLLLYDSGVGKNEKKGFEKRLDALYDERDSEDSGRVAALDRKDGKMLKHIRDEHIPELGKSLAALRKDIETGKKAEPEEEEKKKAPPADTTAAVKANLKMAQEDVKQVREQIESAKDSEDIAPDDAAKLTDALAPHAKRLGEIGKMDLAGMGEGKREKIAAEVAAAAASLSAIRAKLEDAQLVPEAKGEPAAAEAVMEKPMECPTCGEENFGTKEQLADTEPWECTDCGQPLNVAATRLDEEAKAKRLEDEVKAAKEAEAKKAAPPAPKPVAVPVAPAEKKEVTPKMEEAPEIDQWKLLDDKVDPFIREQSKLMKDITAAQQAGTISAEQADLLLAKANPLESQLVKMQDAVRNGKNLKTIKEADVPMMRGKLDAIKNEFEAAKAGAAAPKPAPVAVKPAPPQVFVKPKIAAPPKAITASELETMIDDLGTELAEKSEDPKFESKLGFLSAIHKERINLAKTVREGMPEDELKKAVDRYQKLKNRLDELAK